MLLLISISLLILVVGCATTSSKVLKKETSAYNKTIQENTIEAYKEFIEQYPNSVHIEDAQCRLIKLEWGKTESENSIEAYRNFIKEYKDYSSDSNYIEVAERNIKELTEKLALKNAKSENTIIAQKSSINKYSKGIQVKDEKSKIDNLVYTKYKKAMKKITDKSHTISLKNFRVLSKTFWINLFSFGWQRICAFFKLLVSNLSNLHVYPIEEGNIV